MSLKDQIDALATRVAQEFNAVRAAAGELLVPIQSSDNPAWSNGQLWWDDDDNQADDVVPKSRLVSTGTGLLGGGDLSANRTLSVDFAASGTTSSTKAVRADDSRLTPAATVITADKPATDNATTYPVGLSMFQVSTAGAGWPDTLGVVVTHYINANRGHQLFYSKGGVSYTRSADAASTNGWTTWTRAGNTVTVVYTTTVPARPLYAAYVIWQGQVSPGANAIAGDQWIQTS